MRRSSTWPITASSATSWTWCPRWWKQSSEIGDTRCRPKREFLGVYGAVWLAILLVAATAVFARRMLQLLRVLAMGQKENRLNNLPLRAATFVKEVIFQSRFLKGEPIIKWAHPLIFWGFCFFVIASALLFVGGMPPPGSRIPQAEVIPVLGTVVDFFAVAVLVGLIASSIRRYIFTPPGLQRTVGRHDRRLADRRADGHLFAGRSRRPCFAPVAAQAGQQEAHWGQTWLPAGTGSGQGHAGRRRAGADGRERRLRRLVGARPDPAVLPGLPALFEAHAPDVGPLRRVLRRAAGEGDAAAGGGEAGRDGTARRDQSAPGAVHLADVAQRLCLRRVRPLRTRLSGGGQRIEAVAAADHPRPEGVRSRRRHGGPARPEGRQRPARVHRRRRSRPGRSGPARPATPASTTARSATSTSPSSSRCGGNWSKRARSTPRCKRPSMSLQRYGNSQSKSPRKRLEWAKDLPTPLKDARKEAVETLWFLGDYAALHPPSLRVSRLLALVFQAAGLDFGILGEAEQSAGNDVRRLGEEGPVRDARREEHEGDGEGHLPAHRHHRPAHLPHAQARIRPLRPRQAGRALYRAARRAACGRGSLR